MFTPFFPHVIDAWNKRHHPNMHFVFFEDMKKVILYFIVVTTDYRSDDAFIIVSESARRDR